MNLKLFIHNLLYWLLIRPTKVVPFGKESVWNLNLEALRQGAFVVSAGAGKDISFELELAHQIDCNLILLDPSPTGSKTVESISLPPQIHFERRALSSHSGFILMSRPQSTAEGSWRVCLDGNGDVMRSTCLCELMKKYRVSKIDLLKIDIEGYEYEVLQHVVHKKIPIRQICVEIHEGESFGKTRKDRWVLIFLLIFAGYRLIYQKGWDYTFLRASG